MRRSTRTLIMSRSPRFEGSEGWSGVLIRRRGLWNGWGEGKGLFGGGDVEHESLTQVWWGLRGRVRWVVDWWCRTWDVLGVCVALGMGSCGGFCIEHDSFTRRCANYFYARRARRRQGEFPRYAASRARGASMTTLSPSPTSRKAGSSKAKRSRKNSVTALPQSRDHRKEQLTPPLLDSFPQPPD